ncbi:MAG: hypothetical protein OIF38_07900, partial [Cellvibrionaceae bacterium]|nr:hypothetical protein [Cellvibrionaceae bacterium]
MMIKVDRKLVPIAIFAFLALAVGIYFLVKEGGPEKSLQIDTAVAPPDTLNIEAHKPEQVSQVNGKHKPVAMDRAASAKTTVPALSDIEKIDN